MFKNARGLTTAMDAVDGSEASKILVDKYVGVVEEAVTRSLQPISEN